jgi:hypothetical protein
LRPQQEARCRVLVAAAGYGKTTALRRWYPDAQWHRDDGADPAKIVAHTDADRVVLDGFYKPSRLSRAHDGP